MYGPQKRVKKGVLQYTLYSISFASFGIFVSKKKAGECNTKQNKKIPFTN